MTAAEKQRFGRLHDELWQALSGETARRQTLGEVEALIAGGNHLVKAGERVRATSAVLSNTLGRAEGFITPDQHRALSRLGDDLQQARGKADFEAGLGIADQIDTALGELGPVMEIVISQTLADQNALSPSLAHRIRAAVAQVKAGVSNGDRARFEQGFETIIDLQGEIDQELGQRGTAVPLTKLLDHR